MRAGSQRLAMGFAILALAALDVGGLLLSLRSHARLRERAVLNVRERMMDARPRILAASRGPADGPGAAARYAVSFGLASEAEVFSLDGQRIVAVPLGDSLKHWPSAEELHQAASGSIVTAGPFAPTFRVLSYFSLPDRQRTLLLRLSSEAPDLVADLGERRVALLGHGATLLLLVLAAALLLSRPRSPGMEPTPHSLLAYEEAMARLRDMGQVLEQQHAEEKRRMEERIQDQEALARAGELTAGMTHELRNGLGTILGYARLVERGAFHSEATDAAVGIREECETLERIIRRFMDYVKRESLSPAAFDLRRMLSRVVSRESRGRPGAEVATAEGEMGLLWGDEELLERAFENLVRNAREAAGPSGHVRISIVRDAESVCVDVADDGAGMSEAVKSGLRPFFTTKSGGLGLGLPLALKLVRLHGGSLVLRDRLPRGLVITVRLPIGEPPSEA